MWENVVIVVWSECALFGYRGYRDLIRYVLAISVARPCKRTHINVCVNVYVYNNVRLCVKENQAIVIVSKPVYIHCTVIV